jgi:hypothetical protein
MSNVQHTKMNMNDTKRHFRGFALTAPLHQPSHQPHHETAVYGTFSDHETLLFHQCIPDILNS